MFNLNLFPGTRSSTDKIVVQLPRLRRGCPGTSPDAWTIFERLSRTCSNTIRRNRCPMLVPSLPPISIKSLRGQRPLSRSGLMAGKSGAQASSTGRPLTRSTKHTRAISHFGLRRRVLGKPRYAYSRAKLINSPILVQSGCSIPLLRMAGWTGRNLFHASRRSTSIKAHIFRISKIRN